MRIATKSVQVIPSAAVLYQRERSGVWQLRVKLADGKWHRLTTREHDLERARERALELYYEARAKQQATLPAASRRFSNVAKLVIKQMQAELDAERGKSVYRTYIAALNNVLIPYFGRLNVDSITPKVMTEFEQWRAEKARKPISSSTITNHNVALNKVFEVALQHGWASREKLPTLANKGRKSDVRPTFSVQEYRRVV